MRRFFLMLSLGTALALPACDGDFRDPVVVESPVWETRIIRDIDFVKDTYFYLFDPALGIAAAPDMTYSLRVYKELHLVEVIDPQIISVACRVWFDSTGTGQVIRDALAPLAQGGQPDETRSQFGWFERLIEGVDYFFVVDSEFRTVGIELRRQVRPAARRVLAVAFTNRDGDQIGGYRYNDFRPPQHQTPIDTLALAMIKSRVPRPDGEFGGAWDYAMRNMYDLGLTDIDGSTFELVIEDNLTPRVDATHPLGDPDTLSTPYIRIFGLDQTDEAGIGPPDGRADLTAGLVDLRAGILMFPSLTPFAPGEQSVREWTGDQFWFLDPRFGLRDGKPMFQPQYETSQRMYRTIPESLEFQNLHQYRIVVRAAYPAGN